MWKEGLGFEERKSCDTVIWKRGSMNPAGKWSRTGRLCQGPLGVCGSRIKEKQVNTVYQLHFSEKIIIIKIIKQDKSTWQHLFLKPDSATQVQRQNGS